MNQISEREIVDMVNKINQENEPALEKYIEKFFTEYLDIKYLDDLKVTGHEQQKLEAAITHLVRMNTLISVTTTLSVLEKVGLFSETRI